MTLDLFAWAAAKAAPPVAPTVDPAPRLEWPGWRAIQDLMRASNARGAAARAELVALVAPDVLAQLDRRAPAAYVPGDPVGLRGVGCLSRGVGCPTERYWIGRLKSHGSGDLQKDVELWAHFLEMAAQIRVRVAGYAGPKRFAAFAAAVPDGLPEDVLDHWRDAHRDVRTVRLIAEEQPHPPFYMGWWMYARDGAAWPFDSDRRNVDGDFGWFDRGGGSYDEARAYCQLLGHTGMPRIQRYDDHFAAEFGRRFPSGLLAREGRDGVYHRPFCFPALNEEPPEGEPCNCGATDAYRVRLAGYAAELEVQQVLAEHARAVAEDEAPRRRTAKR